MIIRLTIASLLSVVLLNSCYYNNFKELHPEDALSISACDTSGAISYSAQIVPILNESCTKNCHNTVGSGHDLKTYTSVNNDAISGVLYHSILQDGTARPMPEASSTKISSCDITKIKLWAEAGSPNN